MGSEKCKRGTEEKTKRIEKLKEIYNNKGIDGLINFFKSIGERYRKRFINFQYDCPAVTDENFSEKSWLLLGFLLRRSLAYSRPEHLIKKSVEAIISTLEKINENVDEAIRKARSLFRALRSLKESFNSKALSPEEKKELLIETITQLKTIQEEAKQKLLKESVIENLTCLPVRDIKHIDSLFEHIVDKGGVWNFYIDLVNKIKEDNGLIEAREYLDGIYNVGEKISRFILRDIIFTSQKLNKQNVDRKEKDCIFPRDTHVNSILYGLAEDCNCAEKLKNEILERTETLLDVALVNSGMWFYMSSKEDICKEQ